MGQRLNIEIKKKGIRLANCYYHWSGYTEDSLELIKILMSHCLSYRDIQDSKEQAILLLEKTGAGLMEKEYETLSEDKRKYHRVGLNRNEGLISITDKEMDNTEKFAEATVIINLAEHKPLMSGIIESIDFGVVFKYEGKEEILEYFKDVDFDKIPKLNFDLSNMTEDNIFEFSRNMTAIKDNYGIFKIDNDYYGIIW